MSPWSFSPASVSLGEGPLTLIDGTTFVIASRGADILDGGADGLYMLDTRVLSRLTVSLDGHPVEPLSTTLDSPFAATCIGRGIPEPGQADAPLAVFRRLAVGNGLHAEIEVRNYASHPRRATVAISAAADFAGLFDVKGGRPSPVSSVAVSSTPGTIRLSGEHWSTRLAFDPAPSRTDGARAAWDAEIPPGGRWTLCVLVSLDVAGETITPSHRCGEPVGRAVPAARLATWREKTPDVDSDDPGLRDSVQQATEDLGALRIFDPQHPRREVVAAGAPWFMTIFGRDSIIASWMALLVDPDLAVGTLSTLADRQGRRTDPVADEEPGRILHEVRFDRRAARVLKEPSTYYGSVDSTPLFVMLAAEAMRWGVDLETVAGLVPAVDAALRWISETADRDGDGYVEYLPLSEGSLAHQGWKDSWDGTRYADGRVAGPPIALCEVQGYVYGAHLARADIADLLGDDATAERHRLLAADLKERFNRDFWLPERGWYAMGLDAAKQPVDALASNMGHALWTGIVADEHAGDVARWLTSPRLSTGWGIRTLDGENPGYNPLSYHCGSVWPHDTALAAAGLARYGFREESGVLVRGLLDAAATHGGRLPELFGGFSRDDVPVPVPYPTSCSPQAWAAAAPLLLLRTILGLEPNVPAGEIRIDPLLPPGIHALTVQGIPIAGERIDIEVVGDKVGLSSVPPWLRVILGSGRPHR